MGYKPNHHILLGFETFALSLYFYFHIFKVECLKRMILKAMGSSGHVL